MRKTSLILALTIFGAMSISAKTPALSPCELGPVSASSQATGRAIHFNKKCTEEGRIATSEQAGQRKAASTGANGEVRVPSGTPYDYLYSYALMDAWGDSYIAGKHVNLYLDSEDNSVYLADFMDDYMGDCYYVSGKLIEGDLQNGVLEMDTRKAVYYSYGEWLMLIVASYDEGTGTFYIEDNELTFKLNIKNGVISNYTTYLALVSIHDDTDMYWAQSKCVMIPSI